jgi:hypothetical protein
LIVDPSLEEYISKTTKTMLDEAYTILVKKIVFPRLENIGLKTNPENGRRFARVVPVRKG